MLKKFWNMFFHGASHQLIQEFHSKAVGVTYANPDGSSRQKLIKKYCQVGTKVQFVPEPDNPKDRNAIKVMVYQTVQIGYLPERTAFGVARDISNGRIVKARVSDITGGTRSKPTIGCNLFIQVFEEK